MDPLNGNSDITQFFDFGDAATPAVHQGSTSESATSPWGKKNCPAHGSSETDNCLCHGFMEDIDIPADLATKIDAQRCPHEPAQEVEPVLSDGYDDVVQQEFNNDFSTWIPRYTKPDMPCNYCRAVGLECFIYNKGKGCSPCNALFRTCSFTEPDADSKMRSRTARTALDTLDVVGEDEVRTFGGLTGKKPMRTLGHVGPIENEDADNVPKKGAAAARFPRAAVKILKDWLITHIDHPYPTDEEKEALKEQTGLTISQISNWMANTRRRQKARPKRSASPSIRPSTEAIDIPAGRTWESLNPFERWKHSPPENEPAPMTAIAQAVETFKAPDPGSLSSSFTGTGRKHNSNDSTGSYSVLRAPSTTSLGTSGTHQSSGSLGTAWSHGSRNSFTSLNSINSKKERRRRRRVPTKTPKHLELDAAPRVFQCTFCTDRFKSKYDWSRHEKTLHLSLEKWICAPLGDVITCSSSGQRKCVYCDEVDPSNEHLEAHNHRACEEKGLEARTFYRKDHLRQHLRLMHGCKMSASMESWKAEVQRIVSRCGFCDTSFDRWQDRVDHLAKEFRNGASMKDWKGCRGLDAHIAAHVTNAMPPYLIANESKSPFPFSATSCASMKHHLGYLQPKDLEFLLPNDKISNAGVFIPYHMGDVTMDDKVGASENGPMNTPANSASNSPKLPSNATCWEILTLRLGQYARQRIERDSTTPISDIELQRQARMILYDNDDPMDSTAADNPEWLSLFKKAHGLDSTTPDPPVMSQHDLYEDLGLNANALVDKTFNYKTSGLTYTDPNVSDICYLTGSNAVNKAAHRLSSRSSGTFALPELSSAGTSVSNLPLTTAFPELPNLDAPIDELACTLPGDICIGEDGEFGFSNITGTCNRYKATASGFAASELQATIPEMTWPSTTAPATTTSMDPLATDHFSFSNWDLPQDLSKDFNLVASTAGMNASLPVSSGLGDFGFSGAEVIQGTMGNPQVQRWEDAELGFNMDLDLDMDLLMGGQQS